MEDIKAIQTEAVWPGYNKLPEIYEKLCYPTDEIETFTKHIVGKDFNWTASTSAKIFDS